MKPIFAEAPEGDHFDAWLDRDGRRHRWSPPSSAAAGPNWSPRFHCQLQKSAGSGAICREYRRQIEQRSTRRPAIFITRWSKSLSWRELLDMGLDRPAAITEPLVKLRTLAQLARPGEDVSEDFDQLIKGLEIKGVTQNPKQFQEYMEGIAKGINVFGDTLKPYQYYEMFKYGRQATSALSEKFILGTAPTLAKELGGQGLGAAVSAFNRLLVSGVGKKGSFEELARLGLLDKGAVADIPGTGEGQGIKPGRTVQGWRLAQSDPYEWTKDYLLPALAKAGITDKDQVMREIGVLFQSQRAAQLVNLLATQQGRISKDYNLLGNAQGLSAADRAIREDPGLSWQGLKSATASLVGAAGQSIRVADLFTQWGQAISRFTEGLTQETDAQQRGAPSPAAEEERRRLNRLVFGENTSEGALDVVARKLGWLSAPPEWMDSARAQASLINSGYRDRDLDQELARERARAVALSPMSFRGASDWEKRAAALSITSQPPQPQDVTVTGQAQVEHTVRVEVGLAPGLQAIVDQATNTQDFVVPLLGGGTGRMDTDAAPHRVGIGHM
jgi:hypothetical protein